MVPRSGELECQGQRSKVNVTRTKKPEFFDPFGGLRAVYVWYNMIFITFRVCRRRREMYCGHARLCGCLSAAACPHYCTDPDVTWGSGRGCPLVVHYRADLQARHGLRCFGNVTRTRNVSEHMLVLALCLVIFHVSRRPR